MSSFALERILSIPATLSSDTAFLKDTKISLLATMVFDLSKTTGLIFCLMSANSLRLY